MLYNMLIKKISKYKNLLFGFLAILSTLSIFLDMKVEKTFNNVFYEETGIFALITVCILFFLIKKISSVKDKRLNSICFCLATLFSIFTILGISLNLYDDFSSITGNQNININNNINNSLKNLVNDNNNLNSAIANATNNYSSFNKLLHINIQPLKAILKFVGICILYFIVLKLLFIKLEEWNNKEYTKMKIMGTSKKAFWYCSVIIFLCYVPYLLHYYPGLYHNDSVASIEQILNITNYSNHHPVFYTLYLGFFINIGKIFNNYNIGIAIHSVFQMIMMSLTFAYILHYMAKLRIDYRIRILTFLLFAFLPMNANYALMITKDTPFTLSMSIMLVCIIRMCFDNYDFFKNKKNIFVFIVSTFLTGVFRNNGIYIVLISMPFILFFSKKNFYNSNLVDTKCFKKIVISFSIFFVMFLLYRIPLFKILNVQEGSPAEALSIPLQQFARIAKFEGNNLTSEEKNMINYYLDYNTISNVYNGKISDNVKSTFKKENYEENKIGLFKLYFQLFVKYPRESIEAFLDNNYGYWYPDTVYWKMVREPLDLSGTKIASLNIKWNPIIRNDFIYYIILALNYINLSFVSVLISPGLMFWILIICISQVIYSKKIKMYLIIFIPLLALWLTCIASPVYAMFRYIYPLYIIIPFIVGLLLVAPAFGDAFGDTYQKQKN